MTTLVMMYVLFDARGEIKSIGSDFPGESELYTVSTFSLSEVEGFLAGKKNPSDYYIKTSNVGAGHKYTLVRKQQLTVSTIRTLDTYLTEIPRLPKSSDASILIENLVNDKKIKISASETFSILCNDPDTDEQEEMANRFKTHPPVSLFFTAHKDPYHLLHTAILSPYNLLTDGDIYIEYKADLTAASCYTRKLVAGYSYIIRK